jgi:hypothetical protein
MDVTSLAAAGGCFVVFGAVAVGMGRSALADWREGRRAGDGGALVTALQEAWPAAIAAGMALAAPVVLLLSA